MCSTVCVYDSVHAYDTVHACFSVYNVYVCYNVQIYDLQCTLYDFTFTAMLAVLYFILMRCCRGTLEIFTFDKFYNLMEIFNFNLTRWKCWFYSLSIDSDYTHVTVIQDLYNLVLCNKIFLHENWEYFFLKFSVLYEEEYNDFVWCSHLYI